MSIPPRQARRWDAPQPFAQSEASPGRLKTSSLAPRKHEGRRELEQNDRREKQAHTSTDAGDEAFGARLARQTRGDFFYMAQRLPRETRAAKRNKSEEEGQNG